MVDLTAKQCADILKPGADVKPGDMMEVGRRLHRVTRLDAYPRFAELCPGHTARIAQFDTGLSMTLPDSQQFEVKESA